MDSIDRPIAFVDSSAIVALVDADDAAHAAAVEAYHQLLDDGYRLFTTDHVIVETYDLLANGVGPIVASAWLRDHRMPVYCVDEVDLAAAGTLLVGPSGRITGFVRQRAQHQCDGAPGCRRCIRGRPCVPWGAQLMEIRYGNLDGARQGPPAFCPNCGVANSTGGLRCIVCGQQFIPDDAVASFWETPGPTATGAIAYDPVQDLPDDYDRFADGAHPATRQLIRMRPCRIRRSLTNGLPRPGRWVLIRERPARFFPRWPPVPKRNVGPPAFLLGLIGFLLIAVVGVATAVLVFGPLLGNDVEAGAHDAVASSLAGATASPGTIVVTESQIRNFLRSDSTNFGAISDPAFRLGRNGFTIIFNAPGYSGRITGDLGVSNGQIVVLEPEISGLAGRVIDVDAIAKDFETQVNDWLAAQGLKAQSIENDGNTLTITTVPA